MSATLLGEWCGSSTATLTSTGTSMLVVFNSDYSTVATGFSATYEAGSEAAASYTLLSSCLSFCYCCCCCFLKIFCNVKFQNQLSLPE